LARCGRPPQGVLASELGKILINRKKKHPEAGVAKQIMVLFQNKLMPPWKARQGLAMEKRDFLAIRCDNCWVSR
jgi:hypothetical protein